MAGWDRKILSAIFIAQYPGKIGVLGLGKRTYVEYLSTSSNYAFEAPYELSGGRLLVFDAAGPVVFAGADEDLGRVDGYGVEEGCFTVDFEIGWHRWRGALAGWRGT